MQETELFAIMAAADDNEPLAAQATAPNPVYSTSYVSSVSCPIDDTPGIGVSSELLAELSEPPHNQPSLDAIFAAQETSDAVPRVHAPIIPSGGPLSHVEDVEVPVEPSEPSSVCSK
jgi:hypothetical protein